MPTNYVIGPPGSGKTSYIAQHRQPNELVLDFDALAYALGSDTPDHHTQPHTRLIVELVKQVWFPLLGHIERQGTAGHTVWIIHAYPSAGALRQYQRRGTVHSLGAVSNHAY